MFMLSSDFLSLSLSLSLSSIVAPMDIGNWDGFKTNSKLGGSLFLKNKSDSLRSDTRSRLGSVPAKFALPAHNDDEKIKKIKPHKLLDRLGQSF